MKILPKDTSNSIQNNIIDPVLNITTNCSLLEDEIKKDEDCRWSLNCRLSRNEQVAYEKRKINFLNPVPEDPDGLGFKMNMNDIIATFACVAMEELDNSLKKRKVIGDLYRKELGNLNKIKLLNYKKNRKPNYQIFPIHVSDREKFAKYMWNNNVQVNINNRRNDAYSIFGGLDKSLKNLNRVDEDIILLPIHLDLKKKEVSKIIQLVKKFDKM